MADDYNNNNGALLGIFLAVVVAVGLMFVLFNNDREGADINMPDVNVTGPATPGDGT